MTIIAIQKLYKVTTSDLIHRRLVIIGESHPLWKHLEECLCLECEKTSSTRDIYFDYFFPSISIYMKSNYIIRMLNDVN
jgi:hypothetical protein